jgi:competence protein ComEC
LTRNKSIAVVDSPVFHAGEKIKVDAVIITKNPRVYIDKLHQAFDCKQYIFDASNSMWKINKWKQACDSLHLQYHICSLQGAFEINF